MSDDAINGSTSPWYPNVMPKALVNLRLLHQPTVMRDGLDFNSSVREFFAGYVVEEKVSDWWKVVIYTAFILLYIDYQIVY